MKRCIRNNELVNNYGFLASWRRSSVGLIGSIGQRAEAEAMVARSGTVRCLGTRTQFIKAYNMLKVLIKPSSSALADSVLFEDPISGLRGLSHPVHDLVSLHTHN